MIHQDNPDDIARDIRPPKGRLITGAVIFVTGFIAPVFIPVVLASGLPEWWIAAISGVLALGIPELFMVIAVAILGKEGYAYLRRVLGRFLKPLAPPDLVSQRRYVIGLVLFTTPVLFALLLPYLDLKFHISKDIPIYFYLISHLLIISSLFILGGNFWDKLRGLYMNRAIIVFPDSKDKS